MKNAAPSGAASACQKASQSLRPQAQIKFESSFPAACTSEKTLYGLQVWNLCARGAQIMRAAGRSFLLKKARGLFRQLDAAPSGAAFFS
jgi:hypothetical protein